MSSFTPPVGCTSRNFATVNGFSYIRICIWEWHLQHCNPPRSREEFDRICKWTIDTFREERDKKHEEARSKRNNCVDMPGCVSYQINSNADKFVVLTPDNKLVETIHKYEDSNENPKEKVCKVYHTMTFLCCKPVKIVKHINPLSFLDIPQKYTVGNSFSNI